MTTIIIGAGASGLACAVSLKQNIPDEKVIVLERLSAPGRKILATGNGRCNLTNSSAEGFSRVKDFFAGLGLVTCEEEQGRIYPYSRKSKTVLDILLNSCEKLGVEIITECRAQKIDGGPAVISSKGVFEADSVVVAAGGTAQKNLGSDGSSYSLLTALGHSCSKTYPALVQLVSSSRYPRMLKGSRAKCEVSIELAGKNAGSEYGEVLFTDYGLSGIAVMNLSHIASENFSRDVPEKCVAVLDLVPEMSRGELCAHIEKFGGLEGLLGGELSGILLKQARGDAEKTAEYAKSWRLIITGTKGFDFAQITAGGIPLSEFDGFKSKFAKNVYACGEALDRHFPCGGFNLDFAWSSGIGAAKQIAEKIKNDKNK